MCEFCKIIKKQSLAHTIYENGNLIVFPALDPVYEGHVLIVPKIHAASIDRLPDEVLSDVMKKAKKIVTALYNIYGTDGYEIVQDGGMFCDFGHAHFHVFPRYEKDGFGFNCPKKSTPCHALTADKLRKELSNVEFYPLNEVEEKEFKIAVIVAKYKGRLVLCRHRERITWELPGGHREEGETILETAKRELFEETGAETFQLKPVCAYKITGYAVLYYADIESFTDLPDSEMAQIDFFDELPDALTYPTIHTELFRKAMAYASPQGS